MARTPSAPDLNRRILRMEEEIRQLRLRAPTAGNASTSYQITSADCNNDGTSGWFTEGFPYPTFTRQGDLVCLTGMFHLFLPYTGGRGLIIAPGGVPAEFRPFKFERIFSGGAGFTDDHLWMILLWADGRMTLADMHTAGVPFNHPDTAWGDATVGDQHEIHLNITFPAIDLGLGDFPP